MAGALLLAGCATPGTAISADAGALRVGVAAARQQSQDQFAAANKLIRDRSVEWKVAQPSQILRQSDFPAAVTPEAAQQWSAAFDVLDSYAAALQGLVDPKNATATGDAIGELGQALNGGTLKAGLPPSVVAVFQTFGEALVQARAEKEATAVMRHTDAAFNQVVGRMAAAVGRPSDAPGSLYDSVETAWNASVLPQLENRYAAIPASEADSRRQLLTEYLQAIDARDAQLGQLGQLSEALIALGQAHAAAARGKPGDALFWIQRIGGWADSVRTRTAAGAAGTETPRP
ncbi:MAG: hypothetical protein ACJ8DZ_10535 [Allosphingosinicella sp.]